MQTITTIITTYTTIIVEPGRNFDYPIRINYPNLEPNSWITWEEVGLPESMVPEFERDFQFPERRSK